MYTRYGAYVSNSFLSMPPNRTEFAHVKHYTKVQSWSIGAKINNNMKNVKSNRERTGVHRSFGRLFVAGIVPSFGGWLQTALRSSRLVQKKHNVQGKMLSNENELVASVFLPCIAADACTALHIERIEWKTLQARTHQPAYSANGTQRLALLLHPIRNVRSLHVIFG